MTITIESAHGTITAQWPTGNVLERADVCDPPHPDEVYCLRDIVRVDVSHLADGASADILTVGTWERGAINKDETIYCEPTCPRHNDGIARSEHTCALADERWASPSLGMEAGMDDLPRGRDRNQEGALARTIASMTLYDPDNLPPDAEVDAITTLNRLIEDARREESRPGPMTIDRAPVYPDDLAVTFAQEATGDSPDMERILHTYDAGNATVRATINDTLISICGWSLHSLIAKSKE